MNQHSSTFSGSLPLDTFDETSRANFAACYPETPHKLVHRLGQHPLMQLDALATLAETLPDPSVEYNRAALPLGLNGEKAPANGMGIGETIRNIASTGSWAALKNIEQSPAYADLLM
ncbi:MAG: transcriptional regulator, partial [Sphingomonadales bacterium 39-62-4]